MSAEALRQEGTRRQMETDEITAFLCGVNPRDRLGIHCEGPFSFYNKVLLKDPLRGRPPRTVILEGDGELRLEGGKWYYHEAQRKGREVKFLVTSITETAALSKVSA